MKNFSLKFIDIMVGIVMGLGFQWWPLLQEPWQKIAFVFVYFDIVDYYIDYSPSLKKFPPKREIDVILDVSIVFALFLYIYTTQQTVDRLLAAFIALKALDYFWLLSSKYEYKPTGTDETFVETWLKINIAEILVAAILIGIFLIAAPAPLVILASFILIRVLLRMVASLRYKKIHFA